MSHIEECLLGSMLRDTDVLTDVIDMVNVSDFTTVKSRKVFDALVELESKGTDINVITVSEITGDLDYVTDLSINAATGNPRSFAQALRKEGNRGQCLSNLQKAIEGVVGAETIEDQISAVISAADGLDAKEDDYLTFRELAKDSIKRLNERMNGGGPKGLQTGYELIDDRLMGLMGGDLVIIAGRPGMGKTSYAMNIVENVCLNGGKVVFFSLEMPKQQLMDRLMASVCQIPFREVRTGKLGESSFPKLEAGYSRFNSGMDLHVIDRAALNVDHALNIAKKFNRGKKLDLIVVDYLQLMTAKTESRLEEVSTISRKLKAMAKTLDCPVIALSQLNRKVDDRSDSRPRPSDLRESGQIEQDADIIQFLYRDEVYDESENNPNKGICEVITGKLRNGEPGTDVLESRLDICKFLNTNRSVVQKSKTEGYRPYAN